ncbi:MAG: hypothetical protein IPK66_12590 [Rhodospirillales bacterium]|nr:hypothetical protein [Rhodospirillales bacterium]
MMVTYVPFRDIIEAKLAEAINSGVASVILKVGDETYEIVSEERYQEFAAIDDAGDADFKFPEQSESQGLQQNEESFRIRRRPSREELVSKGWVCDQLEGDPPTCICSWRGISVPAGEP